MNGKAINENSAQQFRNSILPRDTNGNGTSLYCSSSKILRITRTK